MTLRCPSCRTGTLGFDDDRWRCPVCDRRYTGSAAYVDLLGDETTQTGEHYGLQWGEAMGFDEFLRSQPEAKEVMPAAKLGWSALVAEIAGRGPVSVYDAACGFGGLAEELAAAGPPAEYVGADLHPALERIAGRMDGFARWGLLLRWDVSRPLPTDERFDFVLCRASIHHTPDPPATFRALAASLAPGGVLAISAYARKGVAREAVDDALRARISTLPPEEAFAASEAFTALGRALAEVDGRVRVPVDVPLLGLAAGEYAVQELVYDHLLKCFWNAEWGERFSTLVNYDWYHPEFSHRYDVDELVAWFEDAGLEVRAVTSTRAQHYLEGARP